ncbi:hypothetical protein HAV1_gp29 [Hyperthermophilic Archaeal Virus 1]|uniref:hypothetical protein n=1 Tax=Hyperthermophilic Archaeal Virus 1 TaxID=762905 RepID=UPI0001DBAE08|nr:hypothetical protein HAV1_gp29 [Hyperthermophilic Archaeal Virus 1]ADJ54252.1 hypothetical protein HAV1_gp29 [Hyperthermophilic Archaeal Virus 1]
MPIIDYVSVSRVNIIHAYDVLAAYSYAYASRQNVIHAYDVITQPDIATKSGKVAISVADILVFPEWFFRVNKALKIFEYCTPFELATASAVPGIRADDFATVYDLGSLNTKKAVSAFDGLIVDGASYNIVKAVSVLDKLVSDSVTISRSYSSLFFSLFRRRIPISYRTLPVLDSLGISDYASVKKIIVATVSDYAVSDSASAKGAVAILMPDYGILLDSYGMKNLTIHAFDIVPVADYATAIKAEEAKATDYTLVRDYTNVSKISAIATLDYLTISEYADTKKAVAITALDKLLTDSTSTSKSYSPFLFTLLRRRIPISYRTLPVLDSIAVSDSASLKKFIIVSAGDYGLISDGSLARNVALNAYDGVVADVVSAIQAKVVSVNDYIAVSESISPVLAKMVTVLDKLVSDSITTSKSYTSLFYSILRRRIPIRYLRLSIADTQAVADSASVVKIKIVSASDYVVSDYSTAVKTSALETKDYILASDSAKTTAIKTVLALDKLGVSDFAVSIARKTLSVSDYVIYDYVPSINPNDILFMSMYSNSAISGISAADIYAFYERVDIVNRSIVASDSVAIFESISVVKR